MKKYKYDAEDKSCNEGDCATLVRRFHLPGGPALLSHLTSLDQQQIFVGHTS